MDKGITYVRGFSAFGLWVVVGFLFCFGLVGWFCCCFCFVLNLPAKEHDLSGMSEIKLKHQNAHGKFGEQRLTPTE